MGNRVLRLVDMKMTEVGYRGDMCVGADVHIPMGIVPGWVMIRLAGL